MCAGLLAVTACGSSPSGSTSAPADSAGSADSAASADTAAATDTSAETERVAGDVAVGGTVTGEPTADSVAYTGTFGLSTGYATLTIAGKARRVYVYVPANHAAKPPLVVALHGTGGNADDDAHQAALGELGVLDVAEAQGFVVVAPQSTDDGGTNADHEYGGPGWRFDGDADSNPDLLVTRAAIQEARRVLNIDATHVYVVGHSNGAFFSYFVAMRLANRIAAFAENSGGLIPCGQRVDCPFAKPGTTDCASLLAAAPQACQCAIGPTPFPTVKASGRVPQGFLKHNSDDSIVSPVYSCRLAEHLGNRASITLGSAGDHGVTDDFMNKAWAFLAARSLAD